MTFGLRELNRFQRVCRESLGFRMGMGWTMLTLRDSDPRFDDVCASTSGVPVWFNEVNAVAMFTVVAELAPKRIVEIGSVYGKEYGSFFARSLQVLGTGGRVTAIDHLSGDRQQLDR